MDLGAAFARVSTRLANLPGAALSGRLHAQLLIRTKGRMGARLFGSPLLVLRTTGRKSGQVRDTPVIYLEHGDAFVVVGSNAASARTPAWWLNLQAQPECVAMIKGHTHELRARRATEAEAAQLWPRLDAIYSGYSHYRDVTTREFPIVILEPR